jgi:Bcr/CflA subfamily drug resistance transporter
MQSTRFVGFLILFLMMFMQIGTDLYLPSFPTIREELHTTNQMVQHTFSIFLAGFAISQLIYGTLSDRYGRKPFLIIGMAIYFSMCLVCATTSSIVVLLTARGVQGLGAGACTAMSRAIMRDVFSGKAFQRMVLYQTLTWSCIPITAPLLGSYIQHYFGWRYNFGFLAFFSFLGLLMTFLFKETIKQRDVSLEIRAILSDYRQILFHKQFFPPLICSMCVIGAIAAFNVNAPLLLQDTLHLTPIHYGWAVFSVALFFLLGTLINRYALSSLEGSTITSIGISLIGISIFLLLGFSFFSSFSLLMLLIPAMILQVGLSFVFPINTAKATSLFPEMAGKTAAVFGCALFLGGSLTSSIISVLPKNSLFPLGLVLLGLFIIMSVFHMKMLRQREV